MFQRPAKIFPLGDNALTVDFGGDISIETNDFVLRLAEQIERNSFPGYLESVPAYNSLTVFYDAFKTRRDAPEFKTAYAKVSDFINSTLGRLDETNTFIASRKIEIPICFDEEFSADLNLVASLNSLAPEKVIEIFLARAYRVFMLGFLPGFSYMGEIDERIAAPRKDTPRLNVPAGSVGVAGRQTGIYSLASPGGWQIIGRTPLEMFTPDEKIPSRLQAGDMVKFRRIDKREFARIQTEAAG